MGDMLFSVLNDKIKSLPVYLADIGSEHVQEHIIRPVGYSSYQWIQGYKGEGVLFVNNKKYEVKENCGMLLYPNEPHEYYKISGEWVVDWMSFDGSLVPDFLSKNNLNESGSYYITNVDIILGKIRKAIAVLKSNEFTKDYECSSLVYSTLIDIIKYKRDSLADQSPYDRMQPVMEYINHHYHQPITLDELAGLLDITPQHLCILFKNEMNMRPFEYITRVRINKSKEIMSKNKAIKVDVVARQIGYDSTSYFCLMFKNIEGITPGNYQRLYS